MVAQWVKCWPADLVVPSLSRPQGEIFSTVNGAPLHGLSLSTSQHSDMIEILLKRM